jgi:two-component system nitrogen regulation sensor histidine kinase NtrY
VDECIGTIIQEVDELKGLVNEFSQFTRSSQGEKTAQDINLLVEETLPLYQQARPDISLEFAAGSDLPPLVMNRDAVRRALVNLIDNAIAAMDNGAVEGEERRIRVSTVFRPDLSRVLLEVADNGPGVPQSHRARVFEPYFSTKKGGTGLGLALVASVAADHHAYIRLHDNEPRGSRFVMEFPA